MHNETVFCCLLPLFLELFSYWVLVVDMISEVGKTIAFYFVLKVAVQFLTKTKFSSKNRHMIICFWNQTPILCVPHFIAKQDHWFQREWSDEFWYDIRIIFPKKNKNIGAQRPYKSEPVKFRLERNLGA